MVLIISTLEVRDTDRIFLQKLVRHCNTLGHSVTIWNSQNPGLESASYDFIAMPWKLDDIPQGDTVFLSSSHDFPLELFSARLLGTYGQSFEKVTAEEQILRFTALTLDVFAQLEPDCLLVCNGTHIHSAIPVQIARSKGIKTLFFERGMIPGTFCMDREGYGAHSEFALKPLEALPDYENLCWQDAKLKADGALQSLSKAGPRRAFDPDDPALQQAAARIEKNEHAIRIAFFGMAEPNTGFLPEWSAERKRISPFFEHSIDAAKCLADDDRHVVIFKPHPGGLQPSQEQILHDRYIFSNGNPVGLIDWADIVCTNGSSLEFIALAKGKSVFHVGRSILSSKGICTEYAPEKELHPALLNLRENNPHDTSLDHFTRFLAWGMNHYFLSIESDSKWRKSLAFQELTQVLDQHPCKRRKFTPSSGGAKRSAAMRAASKFKSKLRSILR